MRSRILQPGFFKNEELAECDPMARLLFQGLWCIADREGKFEWRPKRIQAELFPYDIGCDILCLLGQLKAPLLIAQYDINGNEYGIIPKFLDHQNPHPHEKKSKLPDPPENYLTMPLNVITSSDKSLNDKPIYSSNSLSTSLSLKEPEFLKNQKLPDVDDIMFSTGPKLKDDLEDISTDLVKKKIFPKAFAFKNKALNENKNKRAILHTLKQCMLNKPKDAYAYCVHVLKIEDGNYNEREATGSSPTSRE